MKLLHTIPETRDRVAEARRRGAVIGLVPTMGALHAGHMALVRRARDECGFVAVSIFVNPTQFGAGEDFQEYPRTPERDLAMCEEAGVDLVFAPSADEMYPRGFDAWVEVGGLTEMLEGERRPGHFRGVTTVCAKLFHILSPDRAYFGIKDYQQLKVIEKMVRDLDFPLRIVPVETVREPDGLAISSRNAYLTPEERRAAAVLSRALRKALSAFDGGERDALSIERQVGEVLDSEPLARVEYADVVDAETLLPVERITELAAVLLAVRIGRTRLIDNVVLGRRES